jgi:hypothetical protein
MCTDYELRSEWRRRSTNTTRRAPLHNIVSMNTACHAYLHRHQLNTTMTSLYLVGVTNQMLLPEHEYKMSIAKEVFNEHVIFNQKQTTHKPQHRS